MGNRRDFLIHSIVEVCQKLDRKGFGANHDGNVTALFEDMILATPTSESKGDIVADLIITLDKEGKKIDGIGKPFSEIKLHLAAYRARPDIAAVVHAHPPFATARGLIGGDFEIAIPEAIVSIGDVIPVVRYAPPGAPENDEIITSALACCDVFMIPGNGVLSVGRDIKEAYLRLELLEHLLKIDYYARTQTAGSMGSIMQIPAEDKQKLLAKRAEIGLGPKGNLSSNPQNEPYTQIGKDAPNTFNKPQPDLIKQLIAEELKKFLKS